MKTLGALTLILLADCATDPRSVAKHNCAQAVYQQFYAGSGGGAFAGGMIGGVVGGVIGGLIEGATRQNTMQLSDIKPAIDRCMASQGFAENMR